MAMRAVRSEASSRVASNPASRSAMAADDDGGVGRIGHHQEALVRDPVHDEVVDDAAVRGADHGVLGAARPRGCGGRSRGPRPAPSPAPGPPTHSSPMWDRSNRPAERRTCACSSRMPRYWTGIYQPPKSMSRAPSATCAPYSGVCAERRRLGHPVRQWQRACDHVTLRGEAHQRLGIRERHPADLVELVVVERQVAADGLHQVVVDGLVDAGALLDEPVLDGPDRDQDAHLEPGLLLHLAERRLLDGLVAVRGALGQRPGDAVRVATSTPEHELPASRALAQHDAARGGRSRRPASAVGPGSVSLAMGSLRWRVDRVTQGRGGLQCMPARPASAGLRAMLRVRGMLGATGGRTDGAHRLAAGARHAPRAPGCWASGRHAAGPTAAPDAGCRAARTWSGRWCRGKRRPRAASGRCYPFRSRIGGHGFERWSAQRARPDRSSMSRA